MENNEIDGFVRVGVHDIEVGKPLPHPLYDSKRNLLLKRGFVIENIRQYQEIIDRGLYRNTRERSIPVSRPVEEAAPPRETITTLEATKVRVGDVLLMQSSAEAPRLQVRLIGYLKNRGLVVTVPESNGELVMLKEGQSFIVRLFSGQNAYAFTVVVAKQTNVPFPHVHLSYPREVRALEIRKGSRVDVELIAAITMDVDGEARAGAGKIVNLSTGGAALRSKTTLGNKGDVINIKFKALTHGIQSYLSFDGLIRAVTQEANDPAMPYSYGLQFVEPEQSMVLALAAFVYQKIVDDAR